MTTREELRERMKNRRSTISVIEIAELSARIAERVLLLPEYQKARRVLCYYGKLEEVMTGALIQQILRSGRELYLPVVQPEVRMAAMRLYDPRELVPGAFGIREPSSGEIIDPARLDLILTPGVAFDRMGGRLGYGVGYFDRFLPGCAALRAGLAFEAQLVDEIPTEPHDALMDCVITEAHVYDCAKARALNVKEVIV